MKLNIKELKQLEDVLLMLNEKAFKALDNGRITIDKDGIYTSVKTKDDSYIPVRDSLVISALAITMLLFIIDKWDSFDSECRKFIENHLEVFANCMEGK